MKKIIPFLEFIRFLLFPYIIVQIWFLIFVGERLFHPLLNISIIVICLAASIFVDHLKWKEKGELK